MRSLSFKGIILGVLTMLAIDGIGAVVGGILVAQSLAKPGMTEQQTKAALAAIYSNMDLLVGSLIIGLLATVLGGYVAVRVAKKAPYVNTGILGVLNVIVGLPLAANYPLWFNIVSFILIVPAALLGGRLAARNAAEIRRE